MASEKIVTESALAALASDAKRAIYDVLPGGSASGNPCTFDTDIAVPLKSLIAKITASGGNGTPATSIPIVGHSELNLVRCGKNFVALNASPYQSAVNTEVSVNSESTDLLSITSSAVPYACRQLYYKLPAGTYTVSLGETTKTGTDNPVISIYDYPNGTLIVNALSANNNVVFTLSDETVLDIRLFATGNTAEVNTVTFNDFQIELGSSSSPYAPYNGQTFTVSFGQTVYGGVLDVTRGKLHGTWGDVDLGTLTWTHRTDVAQGVFAAQLLDYKFSSDVQAKCDIYAFGGTTVASGVPSKGNNSISFYYDAQQTARYVYVYNTSYSDANAFKTAMNGILLAYELATPIEIDVSELSVDTIVGVNNIVSDCNGDVAVEYRESVAKYINDHSATRTDVVGTLTAGQTSITLSSTAITTSSTIEVFTDPGVPYNSLTVTSGQAVLTFDAQANNVSVKVRVT